MTTPAVRSVPAGLASERFAARSAGHVALGIAVACVYSGVSMHRFWNMEAGVDLAIFTQAAQRYAQFEWPWSEIKAAWGFNLLGDHFSPILAVLGPIYAMVPHAWVLLIVQAC